MENKEKMMRLVIILTILSMTPFLLFGETDSRYDTGLNLPFNEKAGDVNPQTGNITLGITISNIKSNIIA